MIWVMLAFFFFEGFGCCLNARKSPNPEAIGLVMFIYFVDLIESFFYTFGYLFQLLRSDVRLHPKGHCSLALLGELFLAVDAVAFILAGILARVCLPQL